MTNIHFMLCTAFLLALTGASVNRTHLMSVLLCMEGMMLTLVVSTTLLSMNSHHLVPMSIIMLALGACEASAGLALLTTTTQKNTNDHLKNLNLLQC
uniref:NADH-ubiquinone oxidoreductase chain 4L n=1 Tax=Hydrosaurus amboinensis TaxID=588074 RepID=D6RS43_9SAUR|nr:NADH dehydrogenase subunit 4L [Hydrosaurus amboinensis]BAJ08133.1 NADH dehydrogenase subunit 4L [Hydrosaurus amboinensis]